MRIEITLYENYNPELPIELHWGSGGQLGVEIEEYIIDNNIITFEFDTSIIGTLTQIHIVALQDNRMSLVYDDYISIV